MRGRILLAAACALLLSRCGENTGQSPSDIGLGSPQNLKALSLNDSTVRHTWGGGVDDVGI
jgi:hypothetical protein